MVSNVEIFDELFERIQRGASRKEILQEFGGSNIYIPSYKTILRDDDIFATYQTLQKSETTQKRIMLTLSQQFNLSEQQLYKIIADKSQPSLF